jgi:hypothetical protein
MAVSDSPFIFHLSRRNIIVLKIFLSLIYDDYLSIDGTFLRTGLLPILTMCSIG